MIWSSLLKVIDNLSLKAIGNRLSKRRLQHELDLHKLYLLAEYHSRTNKGISVTPQVVEEISALADSLGYGGLKQAGQQSLLAQVYHISTTLHTALEDAGDPTSAAMCLRQMDESRIAAAEAASISKPDLRERPRGLSMATGGAIRQQQSAQREPNASARSNGADLSMEDASRLLQERLGYSLRVTRSEQGGGNAGDGLWVQGRAPLGAVVALYPGLVYTPLTYRRMPGYPRVDQGNEYLMSRFDGAVLDAKPWGYGGEKDIAPVDPSKIMRETWESQLERRHPLALAHFANHPSKGMQPNVMVAAYDLEGNVWPPHLRAYIPNVMVKAEKDSVALADPSEAVSSLALVATRQVEDEELLLNYRLSTHVSRPDWYIPVDAEEEQRRWA